MAEDKLVVSSWGGPWKDLIQNTVAAAFTKETGMPVDIVTGGTMDRLAKAKFAGNDPESDVTLTTEQVAWLYASDNLLLQPDLAKLPNAKTLFPQAVTGSGCVGLFSFVYSIVYRKDLVPNASFASWQDLWNPAYADKVGVPDFDPSNMIAVAAKLSGVEITDWRKATDLLLKLKPNVKSYYSTDAQTQEMMVRGDTPVEVMLSGNYYYLKKNGTAVEMPIPKEGAVAGVDCVAINKGTKHEAAAMKFLDIAFRPEIQGAIATTMQVGPMTSNAAIPADFANLPGILTTADQWSKMIVIDPKLRAKLLPEWRAWFTENMARK
ncbi:MAG: ABC transporter substrate-binding protein [Alphaproteobacteria bacterium]|nr:ABC transporter substrate-binding protein [Alphaproteobacteria bacterium]